MKSFSIHSPSDESAASREKEQARRFRQRLVTSVIGAALCMGILLFVVDAIPSRFTQRPRFAITVAVTRVSNWVSDFKPVATRYMNNVMDFIEGLNLRAVNIPAHVADMIGSKSSNR